MNNMSIAMGKKQLVDSIWKSAGIEGLGTTFSNTEKILENLPVQTSRDEVLFIVNMKRAWYLLFDNVDYHNNISFLRELNKVCMNGLYMNGLSFDVINIPMVPMAIGGTTRTSDLPNDLLIIEKLKEIESMQDRLEAALEMFCFIARSQMFLDGNKRVAQLMCNKIMMESDIGIFSIPYDQIDRFKELLVNYYETNNSDEIKEFCRTKCLLLNPHTKVYQKPLNLG